MATAKIRPSLFCKLLDPHWHQRMIALIISALMVCLYLWLIAGIGSVLASLIEATLSAKSDHHWSHAAESMIKDVVVILAALELIRTLQCYLQLGRVKVTFILDAALVVLIGELLSLWYHQYEIREVMLNLAVIAAMILLRIITSRYSPDTGEGEQPGHTRSPV